MKVFEVGGAVRDTLLKRVVHERDWVVVGGSAEELLRHGYKPVGKDFPVFLHPETGEQYALARTERKVGPGYHGFSFDTSGEVSLEEDLGRRDLTINAMARDPEGVLIDPYGGQKDLKDGFLRHVSEAFEEDPLRVLRVARFAARFKELGFTVAAETMELMVSMVVKNEVDALKSDRVWQETEKALAEPNPEVYFEVLRECGALGVVFPEIEALFGIPQPAEWHPEIDTGIHTLMALKMSANLSESVAVRFATLTHDLGKAGTPKKILPKHRGHEERSVKILSHFCSRLPIPRRFRELAVAVARHHGTVHRAKELKPSTAYKLIETVDAIRRPERFEDFLLACEADARGRLGLEDRPYPQANVLRTALNAARKVRSEELQNTSTGPALGKQLRERRIEAIRCALGNNSS
ncbi:MAG: multifunctional CCA addition/repair protein [Pseudomonadota bacterium]|nr:multifunctional CCA addition/repair protein [Pseudomonadota bacterium]